MKIRGCSREIEILRSLDSGFLAPELREHAGTCPHCREVLAVAEFMRREFAAEPAPALPSPAGIWWKAELTRRRSADRRSTRPLVAGEVLAILIAVVIVLLGFHWTSDPVRRLFSGFSSQVANVSLSTLPIPPELFVAAITLLLGLIMTFLVVFRES